MGINSETLPSITVIILNWNAKAYLGDCLAALENQTYQNFQVMLVDNGSTDGSVDFVRSHFPEISVYQTGRNLGFARGNNVALRYLKGDIAFVLNPDVVLAADCLDRVVTAMEADRTIGIAGCKLWYPGSELLQHAGGYVTRPRAIPGHFGVGEPDASQYNSIRDVDYVIGAAMAIRRETLITIGLFDATMFLYFEDVDLCTRARQADFRVVYLPTATAVHVESALAVKGSFAYLHRFHTGRWHYLLKHFSIDEITLATIPAEREWLNGTGLRDRQAARVAYQATLYNLQSIAATRAKQGAGPLPDAAWLVIEQNLFELSEQASGLKQGTSRLLPALSIPSEPAAPFASQIPLIGPLITGVRRVWNNFAGRWYVDHIRQQQDEFNNLVNAEMVKFEQEISGRHLSIDEIIKRQLHLRREASELEGMLNEQLDGIGSSPVN
ncbi:MAG: glycosyltransferase family 2 protein [Chloroflexota bacterium]